MTELWVPIVGSGTDADPFRPDVPEGVAWATDNGVPCDLGPDSPTYGRPVNGHMLIQVADKDAPLVKAAVPADEVPAGERALVECVRVPAEGGVVTAEEELQVEQKVAGLSSAERTRVLAQMALRGLRSPAVEAML